MQFNSVEFIETGIVVNEMKYDFGDTKWRNQAPHIQKYIKLVTFVKMFIFPFKCTDRL